ncbi:unnamed protein product, partial [Porites lobata]
IWQLVLDGVVDMDVAYKASDPGSKHYSGFFLFRFILHTKVGLKLFFMCDENAKIGDKMIYASSKDTIKKSFTGLSLEFQANDKGDLDYKTLSEEVEKKSLVSIHQNTTLKLYNFYFWFCSPAVYFSDGNKYQ